MLLNFGVKLMQFGTIFFQYEGVVQLPVLRHLHLNLCCSLKILCLTFLETFGDLIGSLENLALCYAAVGIFND